MIYLITGSPGTGKTSKVVSMILKNEDGLFKYTADDGTVLDRPLYFCHIDGLDAAKFKAHELTEQQIQSAPLKEIVPTGSVVIVDEADYTYPVRSAGKPVPEYIQTLKELRHEGFTLILMTQHPSMLDVYLRNLVGKHIHLQRLQIGTKQYEFMSCETNLSAAALKSADVSTFYKPDKKAFKYYKSATMHVKFKRRLHWIFYALPVIVIFLLYFLVPFLSKVNGVSESSDPVPVVASEPVSALEPVPFAASVPEFTQAYYQPRVPDMPETAPIYDDVRKVAAMEYPVACVDSDKACNCYTEQGTLIKTMSVDACQEFIQLGRFNPYKQKQPERVRPLNTRPDPARDSPSVLSLGGQPQQNLMYDGYNDSRPDMQSGAVVGN
ncbi:AAA family ATPase [Neisseria weixii]|uniref:AAA family ATPase n=1 Tax=Neisseria weixii TaxID=1853276 RepID=A0A3N4MTI4_9NEIS|nr:zonular occludens toxin domain-containing protein [Neisseria weixii]RPD83060.1 AAA family ATPase [Neisseria weixii]RPD85607.1 AAA family ATPase [Neisseria weixii]